MDQTIHVAHCYCDIPRPQLGYLVQQHFIHHTPTTKLMDQVKTPEWREWVAVVALLDIPPAELLPVLEHENPEKLPHWLACHENIRRILAEEGVPLRH